MGRSRELESRGIVHFRTYQVSDFEQSVRYRTLLFLNFRSLSDTYVFGTVFAVRKTRVITIKIRNYMETMIKLPGINGACREDVYAIVLLPHGEAEAKQLSEIVHFFMGDKLKISN